MVIQGASPGKGDNFHSSRKRLLSVLLAKSLIPAQANLHSNAFQRQGLPLLHQSNKTRCMSMHHSCSFCTKYQNFLSVEAKWQTLGFLKGAHKVLKRAHTDVGSFIWLRAEGKWFFSTMIGFKTCREPARDIPLVTKVMRKEARHTQRWDRASGVPPDILEHLPPKNQSLPTLLLCALTSDFTGGCPPPPSRSLCQRANLQLQLIKFPGN